MGGALRKHKIRQGLKLPIRGKPKQVIEPTPAVTTVAVLADDFPGLKPKMKVAVGDVVKRGQVLFEDRKKPGVLHTSPGAGSVTAVNRGHRRALRSVVIELNESSGPNLQHPEIEYKAFCEEHPSNLTPMQVRALLIESGMWTSLRSRPFDKVPAVDLKPRSIFVTAIDTSPLAPDVETVLSNRKEDFLAGLQALKQLADGQNVHLCRSLGSTVGDSPEVAIHEFEGPHPAGNPGLHIHLIDPADRDRPVWHVGYQDVAAIGFLFLKGKIDPGRIISIAGPAAKNPRLLTTRIGARISELVDDELSKSDARIISGSVLGGRTPMDEVDDYLGRYHNQISLISQNPPRRFLGWMAPGTKTFSAYRLFLSKLAPKGKMNFTTDSHGALRAMVPLGMYDKVMPFDLMTTFLLRALISDDLDEAEQLGCLELSEEDLALCSFVCPSKIDYGPALRKTLDAIEKEG